jgi:hypothetical protein
LLGAEKKIRKRDSKEWLRQGLNTVARKAVAGSQTGTKRATKGAPFGPDLAQQRLRTTGESPAAAPPKNQPNKVHKKEPLFYVKNHLKIVEK